MSDGDRVWDTEEVAPKPDKGDEVFDHFLFTLLVREGFHPRAMGMAQHTTHKTGQVRLAAFS